MACRNKQIDLEYVIIGMKFDVEFASGEFTDVEKQHILDDLNEMSREIHIDRSYVDCKQNRRGSAFMLETGWNSLADLIVKSKFGRYQHNYAGEVIVDAFATMGRCYMQECLCSITDKHGSIDLSVNEDCEFEVVVCKDTSHDYKKYLGCWQDWTFDGNGHFTSTNSRQPDNATGEDDGRSSSISQD